MLDKLDAALGLTKTPLVPLNPPPRFAVRQSLDEPAITADAIAFLLRRMTQLLSEALAREGCGSTRLVLKLYRVDGSRVAVQAGLAAPSVDGRHMASLLAPKLDGLDLGFGIEAATLEASETATVEPLQTSLAGRLPARFATARRLQRWPTGSPTGTMAAGCPPSSPWRATSRSGRSGRPRPSPGTTALPQRRRRTFPGRSCCSPRPSRSRSLPRCPMDRPCILPGAAPPTG